MKIYLNSSSYNGMRGRDLRRRFPGLTYREAVKIAAQVSAERYHRQFYSSAFQLAAAAHDAAYAFCVWLRQAEDRSTELRYVGIVNALYHEADQALGDPLKMEDAKARALLAKQAWRNSIEPQRV